MAEKKSGLDLTPLPAMRKNRSIINLQDFFMREFLAKGDNGLPVRIDVSDPEDTDQEYEDLVMSSYRAKPQDYEIMLCKKLASDKTACRCKNCPHTPT